MYVMIKCNSNTECVVHRPDRQSFGVLYSAVLIARHQRVPLTRYEAMMYNYFGAAGDQWSDIIIILIGILFFICNNH